MDDSKDADTDEYRINRYIMECKFFTHPRKQSSLSELIDTLWNVNTGISGTPSRFCPELIDTLWNVNTRRLHYIQLPYLRINRYIMECKFGFLFPTSYWQIMN